MDYRWRHIAASVIGSSHLTDGIPCQDANAAQVLFPDTDDEILVAAVADGAGTAEKSAEGSALVCRVFQKTVARTLSTQPIGPLTEAYMRGLFADTARQLFEYAKENGRAPRDYATTFLGLIADRHQTAIMHIGDGAIIRGMADETYECVSWPQNGEYINSTNFISEQNADEKLDLKILDTGVEEIAMFTDGIQMLTLQYAAKAVHAPFFRPMFVQLRQEPPGEPEQLKSALSAFLASPRILERTDDDKTLFLASRKA